MASTRPTDQQLAFFETFGFLAFPGLLADRIQLSSRRSGPPTAAATTAAYTTAPPDPARFSSSTRART
jgi:hypothetical protein